MVNMFQLAVVNILKISVSLWTNQSKCTYTTFEYDNKREISIICASSEQHLINFTNLLLINYYSTWKKKANADQ